MKSFRMFKYLFVLVLCVYLVTELQDGSLVETLRQTAEKIMAEPMNQIRQGFSNLASY